MANKFVEKMKEVGLNHGEKIAVGLTGVLSVVLLFLAASKPLIDITPDQVKSTADKANAALNAPQEPADVIRRIEEEAKVEEPSKLQFAKKADEAEKNKLVASAFTVATPWILPEPGAGLMREKPTLLASRDALATSGRGGMWVIALDENGKRKRITSAEKADKDRAQAEKEAKKKPSGSFGGSGGRGSGGPGAMSGMSGGSGGFFGGPSGKNSASEKKKQEDADREAQRLRNARFGGKKADDKKADDKKDKDKVKEDDPNVLQSGETWVEELKGGRWAIITAIFNNEQQRELYASALKLDKTTIHPNYKEVEIQRQELKPDGSWSEWTTVAMEDNRKITDNIPEKDQDFSPEDVRLATLAVDLPFLRVGNWIGSEPLELIPEESLKVPTTASAGGMGMMGMMGGGGMGMMGMSGMGGRGGGGTPGGMGMMGMGGRGGMSGMGGGPGAMSGMGGGPGGMSGMMGMGGRGGEGDYAGMSGFGMMGGGSAEPSNFPKSEAKDIMIRQLDLTVMPETTYRYRLRIVVYNPNYERENVVPGTDVKSVTLEGPWSEPTPPVSIPADSASFLVSNAFGAKTNPNERDDRVQFHVTNWNEPDGVTLVKDDVPAGPGELLGNFYRVQIPDYSGDNVKIEYKNMDFVTNKIVVDTTGDTVKLPKELADIPGGDLLTVPPTALLLRNDGQVVVHQAMNDVVDPTLLQIRKTYRAVLKENGAKKKPDFAGMGMGMEGGMSR